MVENRIKFPYKIQPFDMEVDDKWKKDGYNYVQVVGPQKITVFKKLADFAEDVYNFEVRPDDVWITTFARSGTTLIQEMVWMILNDDYETARKIPLVERVPFFENFSMMSEASLENFRTNLSDKAFKHFLKVTSPPWETFEKSTERRIFKTHLQYTLLPPALLTSGCKVVYVARNPKDVAVSFFKYVHGALPDSDFPEFWKLFQKDYIENAPYWEHVKQGWNQRNNKNVCFMFYEDIVQDRKAAIRKVSKFLEKDMTEEQIDKLAEHLKAENFMKNASIMNNYRQFDGKEFVIKEGDILRQVRVGKSGGWRNYFNAEINEIANKWIEENYQKTDLRFPTNLLK